ncbi:hypothetical protein AVEN_29325-1 [Araneus ventricosus]|uniref:Helitron helicase-like domain-containing protein n=1 Tax=Araneus ventricosus TaxID=182803 RepID=A0A4Y2IXJ3_ARAVE|nr:hypothetical protein AVEN_29325-1 [Araneus ventricosus]
MMLAITKGKIYGDMLSFMFSIEWQKRCLLHGHILLWLKDKLRLNQIHNIISVEIPDPSSDKKLQDVIFKSMIRSPCGPNENIEYNDFIYNEAPTKVKDQVITITGNDLSSFGMRRPRMTDEDWKKLSAGTGLR